MKFTFRKESGCIMVFGTGMGNPPSDAKNDCCYGYIDYAGKTFTHNPTMDYFSFDDLQQIVDKMKEIQV
jgi:hypothetical protein